MRTAPATLREVAKLAAEATPEQLDAPIEVVIRTYTGRHATYPESFEIALTDHRLRVYAAYPEGITIHERRSAL
jgi:hypothetical protein